MFFKKKDQKELRNTTDSQLRILDNKFDSLNQGIVQGHKNIEDLTQKVASLQSEVNKHNMAIEDLLDEWEEKSSNENSTQKLLLEARQNEQQLLELFEAYQEQFWNLKHFAGTKDETWASQMALMEKKLEHYQQLCGINAIKECGVEVDYSLHEVIEAINTADSGQDKKVAGIYHCGYIYKGQIKKKAVVSAYRKATH